MKLTIDRQNIVVVSGIAHKRVPRVPARRDVFHPIVLLKSVTIEIFPDISGVIPSAIEERGVCLEFS